ncbi:MAG: tRNA guanosine(34) transglycosylase Tgt [candidate division NC10 bacterium]|nr:tRNA guanosine(34) transglycosylase Tgt [candidate division NC10 bacterium]
MRVTGFGFEVLATDPDTGARRGRLATPHGTVESPVFIPCGTQATVKTLSPRDLEEEGVELILCNTYHLSLRPGAETIAALGGLHRFMAWPRALLTDSGGYQVFSMAELRRITEEGVHFRSHLDGSSHTLTPEGAIAIQEGLGADIVMAFDDCTPYPATPDQARASLELTLRWAERCLAARTRADQALFGIVQGSVFPDLRAEAADRLTALPFDGYAIGGLSVGESKGQMLGVLRHTAPRLPAERPRYLMGIGTPEDLLLGIAAGIDMFDCVMPTRHGRTGSLFTRQGRLSIKAAEYARDARPVDPECACYTCRTFSRAYLRHLFVADETLGLRLNTLHNVHFYLTLMAEARQALVEGTFAKFLDDRLTAFQGSPDGSAAAE